MVTGLFFCLFSLVYPYVYPFQDFCVSLGAGNTLDKCFHAGGAVLFHLICHVAVDIQSKGGGSVAQVPLHGLDVIPGTDCGHGITVSQIMKTGVWAANGSGGLLNAR